MKFTADMPEPSAKKSKSDDDVVENPIPRSIPSQSVTLNFTQRSWEEIAPGELYYLPICQNPFYIMDECMINQFKSFDGLWSSMEISTPHVKISNLIMLQDDLRVQNNTPTDATAFTQVVYLIHYVPQNQQMYFALQSLSDLNEYDGQFLTYQLAPQDINSRMVKVSGFEDFEKLLMLSANPGESAGFDDSLITDGTGYIYTNYVSPLYQNDFKRVAGNMQMDLFTPSKNPNPDQYPTNFLQNKSQILFAKNQDNISFHKYGDCIEFDIVTNLEGKKLISDDWNDFTESQRTIVINPGEETQKNYMTEWCWPGKNRPYVTRSSNLDYKTDPVIHAKDMKPLKHHFFCMPPIRKPNGALLGQRTSFLLEQSFSVTFHFSTAVFADDLENSDIPYIMDQKDGILMRRNFYGIPGAERIPTNSPFCGTVTTLNCRTPVCPVDTFQGLLSFYLQYFTTQALFQGNYEISNDPNLFDPSQIVGTLDLPQLTESVLLQNQEFQRIWIDMASEENTLIRITITNCVRQNIRIGDTGQDVDAWVCGRWANDVNAYWFYVPVGKPGFVPPPEGAVYLYVTLYGTEAAPALRQIMARNGVTCINPNDSTRPPIIIKSAKADTKRRKRKFGDMKAVQHALVYNKLSSIFFS